MAESQGATASPAKDGYFPIRHYITPPRRVLLFTLILLLASSALALANPWFAGQLARVLADESPPLFDTGTLLLLWFALITVKSLLDFQTGSLLGGAAETVTAELRSRLYQHMQFLPYSEHQARKPGETLTLLSNDAEIVSGFVISAVVQVLPALLTLVAAVGLMFLIDPPLALIAIALVPFYFLCIRLLGRRIKPLSRSWVNRYSELVSMVEENIRMLPAIKAFSREHFELDRFDRQNKLLLSHSRLQVKLEALLPSVIGFLAGSGMIMLLYVGTQRLESGHLSVADLVSLLLYALLLGNPLRSLASTYGQMQRCSGAAERIIDFLDIAPEPRADSVASLPQLKGNIEFRDVVFSYRTQTRTQTPVLRELNLSIKAGETVAITGTNGAGKSTLAHLLMRFADPQSGSVRLDGHDLREVSLSSLRSQVCLVAQDTLLLNATVAENISYGAPSVDQARVEQAARAAHAHEFVQELPEKYRTVIGDQGSLLSGGQRQRIALARALLLETAILVLDEATAMFDPEGEERFIRDCRQLFENKTVLLITHRAASLALADRTIALKDGKIHA